MSKTKKSHKSSDSESETSEESSSSSSESTEVFEEKREKKKRKQKDKKKKKHKHKKGKSAKKKSKHNSGSENQDSSESLEFEKSSDDERKTAKKKIKKELSDSAVRIKKERSRSREKDKYSSKSKWESPLRRERSHSREKYRKDRSRSRERHRNDRSRSRNRERSRDRNTERYRGEIKRDRDDRRDYRGRDRDRAGSYDRRERSPRRDRDRSRERDRSRDRNRDRDYVKREPHSPNHSRGSGNRFKQQRKDEDDKTYEWGKASDSKDTKPSGTESKEKEKPNFALSGALTEDANKVNGVVVKYAEPPEARKPKRRWRLYPFKGETALPVLHIHRQSCFLVGRDRKVVDLAVDHPSCSKQHAALQYRLVPFEREDGTQGKRVRLYLIDLDSANGTFLNNKRIDPRKYYELMEKDVIKFGFSTREYVLLHENSKEDQEDDDIEVKEEPMDN